MPDDAVSPRAASPGAIGPGTGRAARVPLVPFWTRLRLTGLDVSCAGLLVLLLLPLCLILAVIVPAGQVADEPNHIAKAVSLLHGEIIGRRAPVPVADGTSMLLPGLDVDPGPSLAAAALKGGSNESPRVDSARLERARAVPWFGRTVFMMAGTIANYSPVFYAPAAAAMGVARLAGATPLQAIAAGRMANALAYALLGGAALLLARRGKALLFCTLALPVAASLGASLNQDGLMIASMSLAAALLSRAWERPATDIGGRRAYRLAAALVVCVAIAKPPYAPLALILLPPLPPLGDWRHDRMLWRRAGAVAIVLGAAVAWSAVVILHASTPMPRAAYTPGPLWPGDPARVFNATDPGAQMAVLRAHPLHMLVLSLRSLIADTPPLLWREFIGVLGWLNVVLPAWLYRAWSVALACAVLADMLRGRALPGERPPARLAGGGADAAMLALAAFGCILCIYVSQYLIWTNVGLDRIEGIQGRYFLPLAPLLALALPRFSPPGRDGLRAALLAVPVLIAAADVVVLPLVLVRIYYMG